MGKLVLALMTALSLFGPASAGFAQERLPSMTVKLTGTPETYQGTCPVIVRFDGVINTTRPTRAHYKFIRSDGAYSPTETAPFETSGAKEVSTNWMVGAAEQSRYEGWMTLKITHPEEIESQKARFKVVCTGMSVSLPDLTIDDVTLDEQCRVVVKARNVGPGPVFEDVWTDHKPDSPAITLYIDGRKWGGEAIWLLDRKMALQNPGGTVVFTSNLKVDGTQTIKVKIDQTRQVKETDEGNNERTVALTCEVPSCKKQ